MNEIGDVLEQRIDLCDDLVLGKIGCYDHRVTKLCEGHDVTLGNPSDMLLQYSTPQRAQLLQEAAQRLPVSIGKWESRFPTLI